MAKFQIQTYNNISQTGLNRFGTHYEISDSPKNPDAVILRSFNLHSIDLPESVVAVGRAGAGVNNIPVEKLSKKGVVVMNTPGANANAVNELVIASILLTSRNLAEALNFTSKLSDENLKEDVEKGKKQFAGIELREKTLGIIGLGAIGQRVANSAAGLGMHVIGYDPYYNPNTTQSLPPNMQIVKKINKLLGQSDYITLHVPLLDSTKGMVTKDLIALIQPHAIFLNFSRDELVDERAILKALDTNKLARYVTDFPNKLVKNHSKVIALPHLGGSTAEAEENCAVMIADQIKDYLQNGNIQNSVNYPTAVLPKNGKLRLTFLHQNKPGIVAKITKTLGKNINIAELLNNSRGDLAYTIMDIDSPRLPQETAKKLQEIPEIFKLRILT